MQFRKAGDAEECSRRLSEYESLVEACPDPVARFSVEGRCLYVNPVMAALAGRRREDIIGKTTGELGVPRAAAAALRDAFRKAAETGQRQTAEISLGDRNLRTLVIPETGARGTASFITYSHDITERAKAEEECRRTQAVFNQAEEMAHLGAWEVDVKDPEDLNANRLSWSDEVYRIFGYAPGSVPVTNAMFFSRVHPDDRAKVAAAVRQAIDGKRPYSVQHRIVRPDGSERIVLEHAVVNYDEQGRPRQIIGAVQDITEGVLKQEEVKYLGLHDKTTGLYNWTYFEEELKRLDNERELPLSVIMGDVNNLKLVNDVYGHQEGDMLLRVVADSIRASCRDSDIIARWGGGEFIILLPGTGITTAEKIAARIKERCAGTNTSTVRCSIAVGVAEKTRKEQSMYEKIRRAQERMFKHKILEANENRRLILSSMLEKVGAMNEETREHNQRSRELAVEVGRAIGLSRKQLEVLKLAASVHDIGKAAMPAQLLEKPTKLTAEEWREVKRHTEIGYRVAHAFPELSNVADAILYHHERWDGRGYPRGLKGEEIPLLVRILTIIDAYDVMTHGRPYEKVLNREEAIKELERNAGTQFDPELVKVFIVTLRARYKETAKV